MSDQPKSPSSDMQGEGNYDAARRFRKEEEAFVKSGKVEAKAKEAEAALDGPEGAELERARHEAARGEPKGAAKAKPEAH